MIQPGWCSSTRVGQDQHGPAPGLERSRPAPQGVGPASRPCGLAIVIIDNLGSPKGQSVHKLIWTAVVHLFFLPPRGPDLNPIEVFAKLDALFRNAAAGSMHASCRRAGPILKTIRPQEGENDTTASGLASI